MRLDARLVAEGKVASRSRAADLIKRGLVRLEGRTLKASDKINDADFAKLEIDDHPWVSRAALKLVAGLEACPTFDPSGQVCVDIGASTGGFCQVLLEAGAARVFAVDVGHDQLHPSLNNRETLVNLQGVNARDLSRDDLHATRPTRLVCDVSFISVTKALPVPLMLMADQAQALILVKPQFEVGRDGLMKDGVAKEPAEALDIVRDWLARDMKAWREVWTGDSPVKGGDGNHEYLMHLERS